jgi:malate/lactate dehydrogenase
VVAPPANGSDEMKVTVIGAAGSVGAPAAFYLAVSGLVDELVLLDIRPNVVQQHALDMSTACSASGLTVAVKAGSYPDLAGSDVVINAAGVHQGVIADRMEMLPKNISLVCDTALQLKRHCPEAIIITATNPVDPLNYAIWLSGGFDRRRVIGYTINDSFRFRELIARRKGVSIERVWAIVVGEHGSTQVPLFSSARIDGDPVEFGDDEKCSILEEIPTILKRYEELQSGRTAGWTCAVGLLSLVRAIHDESDQVFPCSVVLDGEYGQTGLSMGVPVVLGRTGLREIKMWELEGDELAAFTRSAAAMSAAARIVDEQLSAE